eukprot:2124987-Lingulodinium_polyedra.AAC.1
MVQPASRARLHSRFSPPTRACRGGSLGVNFKLRFRKPARGLATRHEEHGLPLRATPHKENGAGDGHALRALQLPEPRRQLNARR